VRTFSPLRNETNFVMVQELGAAALSKRPTSCMLILPKPLKGVAEVDTEFDELYAELEKKIKAATPVNF
jgi:H/ACA ribonucleoprotein complex subunit 2